jgi:hypothetical protein
MAKEWHTPFKASLLGLFGQNVARSCCCHKPSRRCLRGGSLHSPDCDDLKACPAFMPEVQSASPARAISHTPLEDVRTPRSFLSYAAQATASFILELPFRISHSAAVIEAVANP